MGNLVKETPFSEITATLETLDALGVTRENLASLRKSRTFAQKIAEMIMAGMQLVSATYKVVVDYSMSLVEMIKAGQYDWVSDDITAKRFELQGAGQHEVNLVLVHLDREATTKEAREYLKEQGLESAKIEHLLAFGTTYPEVQREFPVVALGSSFVHAYGVRHYPCLDGDVSERRLYLYWSVDDGRWDDSCRFLAVRK